MKISDVINADIAKRVVDCLLNRGLTITFAESCTGGLVSKKITDVSGASGCFECGFVTYSNEKKQQLLNVSADTLLKYGAVSHQTAYEMCIGARKAANADIAVSITGIAGPGGGTDEKPVGLVYVGIACDNICAVCRLNLSGDREFVREQTAACALDLAYKAINNELKTQKEKPYMIDMVYE